MLLALLSLGITVLIKAGQSCQLIHLPLSVQKCVDFSLCLFSVSRCNEEEQPLVITHQSGQTVCIVRLIGCNVHKQNKTSY